ncbi:MAG: LysR substrate-binding domain-containing protein, partial [Gammaproteobacteria bacterium]|nr:LysR substrate-binding domain-containing protein [Gammaproteobacteria bacterium]
IDPSAELADFERDGVDVGIRYGLGNYPGMHAHRLLDEDIFPVCTPELCGPPSPLNEPSDLRHYELLRDDGHGDWRTWLLAAGAKGVDADRGPVFTDSSMLIEAAIAGQGVALAREVLARDALATGRLVRPFSLSLPTGFAYYLVYPRGHSQRPGLNAFRQWILREAQDDDHEQPA